MVIPMFSAALAQQIKSGDISAIRNIQKGRYFQSEENGMIPRYGYLYPHISLSGFTNVSKMVFFVNGYIYSNYNNTDVSKWFQNCYAPTGILKDKNTLVLLTKGTMARSGAAIENIDTTSDGGNTAIVCDVVYQVIEFY